MRAISSSEAKGRRRPSPGGLHPRVAGAACVALVTIVALVAGGCGTKGLPMQVVHGKVTCGGQTVDDGEVRFVPIEGTFGPVSVGTIVSGEYRIEARGGVPLGKHRVEVRAMRTTGAARGVAERTTGERTMVAVETFGPPIYDSPQSPLVKEVTSDGDGRIDIEIPGK